MVVIFQGFLTFNRPVCFVYQEDVDQLMMKLLLPPYSASGILNDNFH